MRDGTREAKASRSVRPTRRGAPALEANVAELRALAHPMRLRLVELFAEAPRTTKQAALVLGVPPTRLYHHVNALERAGLVRLRETRANRGAVEKWYEASPRWSAAAARRGDGGVTAPASTAALARTLLDQAGREVGAALDARATEPPLIVRLVAVGAARRDEIRRRIHALLDELQAESAARPTARRARTAADADRWSLTLAFAPVSAPRGEVAATSKADVGPATKARARRRVDGA